MFLINSDIEIDTGIRITRSLVIYFKLKSIMIFRLDIRIDPFNDKFVTIPVHQLELDRQLFRSKISGTIFVTGIDQRAGRITHFRLIIGKIIFQL